MLTWLWKGLRKHFVNKGIENGNLKFLVPPDMSSNSGEIEVSNDPIDVIVEQPQKFNKNDIRSFGKIGVQTKNR